jgi:putative ABC transport system permease protein
MLRQFKIASRFLLRHKQYSFVNTLGLTLSLAAVLVIALYLYDELSFDKSHSHADRIYRVIENQLDENGEVADLAGVAFRTTNIQTEIPAIEKIIKLTSFGRTMVSTDENQNKFYEQYTFTDQSFFDVFDFDFVIGSRSGALDEPYTVVLTESTAKRIFGTNDVVGKVIQTDRDDEPYTITGVLEDFPSNSHLSFNMLFSFASHFNADW